MGVIGLVEIRVAPQFGHRIAIGVDFRNRNDKTGDSRENQSSIFWEGASCFVT